MPHTVDFIRAENDWRNGLMLGNGVMGGLVFYRDNALVHALNHYEVYYASLSGWAQGEVPEAYHGSTWADYTRRADKNVLDPTRFPIHTYHYDTEPDIFQTVYGTEGDGESQHGAGELRLSFADRLRDANSLLRLDIERATISLELTNERHTVRCESVMLREDCLAMHIHQSHAGLCREISVELPPRRAQQAPEMCYQQIDARTFSYTASFSVKNGPVSFTGIIRLLGAQGQMRIYEGGATIELVNSESDFSVLTGIFTTMQHSLPLEAGQLKVDAWETQLPSLYSTHAEYWQAYFSRANVMLPDKFLERIWYINLYALDCCSGRGGIMAHQACGLNGLWDVRQPTIWGSMWYWDVNIQAAFSGVFSSDQLELGESFTDGLLHYVPAAKQFAQNVYGLEGCAFDYPFTMYHCIWPWCAAYVWTQYEYSGDMDFLRKKAYPLFLALCEFGLGLFQWDEERGVYSVYPDISPEQGPFGHNAIATMASTKYLLQFTLKAAEILGDSSALLERCRHLLENLPAYPISRQAGTYGQHFIDTEDAPDEEWLRHPSLLMPIYPIGEIDARSDPKTLTVAQNTMKYLEARCEIGVFTCGWVGAAYARLGNGQAALRLLYEKGIDHILRSNGLAAEETERFVHYSLVVRPPLYYPCMVEFTGEVVATVNEMLLQSHDGVVRIFPALPDGDPEYWRFVGRAMCEYEDMTASYPAWQDVHFDGLLARGGFKVSAALVGGELAWIRIYSRLGGPVRVASPFLRTSVGVWREGQPCTIQGQMNEIAFDTVAGAEYIIAASSDAYAVARVEASDQTGVMERLTYTKRRIFIGEDQNTEYKKAVDGFLRDWHVGNIRHVHRTPYKFDFGAEFDKDYFKAYVHQVNVADPGLLYHGMVFKQVGAQPFIPFVGYGFASAEGVRLVVRAQESDLLRRDFVEGEAPASFLVELPQGRYDLLIVSGDAQEDSITCLRTPEGTCAGGDVIPAGRYQCAALLCNHPREGILRIDIASKPGYRWKLNLLLMNIYSK